MLSRVALVLFDGVCNFCNSSVNFVMDRDKGRVFRFASLQSQAGQQVLAQHPLPPETDSIVLVEDGKAYTFSTAALRITRKLSGLWPLLYVFILVPRVLRDLVYKFIAANRYRWFGRQEACRLPSAEDRERFLPEPTDSAGNHVSQ